MIAFFIVIIGIYCFIQLLPAAVTIVAAPFVLGRNRMSPEEVARRNAHKAIGSAINNSPAFKGKGRKAIKATATNPAYKEADAMIRIVTVIATLIMMYCFI